MVTVTSWGRLAHQQHHIVPVTTTAQVSAIIANNKPAIAYGMGRSYGDVCLNPSGILWMTRSLDHLINFNSQTGELTCEAGVLLCDIQLFALHHGWMLPVTPGTQMITVGGAIANDVHGKNHHQVGSFGHHVKQLICVRTTGETIICSPKQQPEWFNATIGGIGLTGVITQATLQLRKVPGPWLWTENIPFTNLTEFFKLAHDSASSWEYTIAWIDCLAKNPGRGIFMRANHTSYNSELAPVKRKKITFPIVPLKSLINSITLRSLNFTYYYLNKFKARASVQHYEKFFYPLDNIQHWNRAYGPKGFYQYQCLIPMMNGQDAITAMLKKIALSKTGSFLAVLKTFGSITSIGMLSFPAHGVTFALDFPNQGPLTEKLLQDLDAIVSEAGGKIYLAKDARMPQQLFTNSYHDLEHFVHYRDPGISSALAKRLIGY